MNDAVAPASPQLQDLNRETIDLGYQPGMDFAIKGMPQGLSSEIIILTEEDDSHVV